MPTTWTSIRRSAAHAARLLGGRSIRTWRTTLQTGFDLSQAHFEFAPAQGEVWTYVVRIGPSRLVVKRFAAGPSPAKAGQPFVAMLGATRNDTGAAVTTGEVGCTANGRGAHSSPAVPRLRRQDRCVSVRASVDRPGRNDSRVDSSHVRGQDGQADVRAADPLGPTSRHVSTSPLPLTSTRP